MTGLPAISPEAIEGAFVLSGRMIFPEQFRWKNAPRGYSSEEGSRFGAFRIPGRAANGRALAVIAIDGEETGWEHVSVSLPDSPKKCPSWDEMCIVKRLFWTPDCCVVQFHPAEAEYVDVAQVLHLWRNVRTAFPAPPRICV